jgi:predicted ATPase
MIYLTRFDLPGEDKETEYKLRGSKEIDWSCYSGSGYPFGVFPLIQLDSVSFDSPIVIFCGENGSGKSTLLNVIAEKLGIKRSTSFNRSVNFGNFVSMCKAHLYKEPRCEEIITSDSVFDYLLDVRAVNDGLDSSRQTVFETYDEQRRFLQSEGFAMRSLEDYDELKKYNEIRRTSKSEYTRRRVDRDVILHSNGESALGIFVRAIKDNALYLLDEPENSLSASHQKELAEYISGSARFYNCQFIISSHSPFLLSLKGAEIYDLDARPVCVKKWTELGCIREYAEIFRDFR